MTGYQQPSESATGSASQFYITVLDSSQKEERKLEDKGQSEVFGWMCCSCRSSISSSSWCHLQVMRYWRCLMTACWSWCGRTTRSRRNMCWCALKSWSLMRTLALLQRHPGQDTSPWSSAWTSLPNLRCWPLKRHGTDWCHLNTLKLTRLRCDWTTYIFSCCGSGTVLSVSNTGKPLNSCCFGVFPMCSSSSSSASRLGASYGGTRLTIWLISQSGTLNYIQSPWLSLAQDFKSLGSVRFNFVTFIKYVMRMYLFDQKYSNSNIVKCYYSLK